LRGWRHIARCELARTVAGTRHRYNVERISSVLSIHGLCACCGCGINVSWCARLTHEDISGIFWRRMRDERFGRGGSNLAAVCS